MQGGNKKMDQFIQYTPTEVVFGKETENQAGAEVKKWGGTKVLVVYGGGSAKRSGLLAVSYTHLTLPTKLEV